MLLGLLMKKKMKQALVPQRESFHEQRERKESRCKRKTPPKFAGEKPSDSSRGSALYTDTSQMTMSPYGAVSASPKVSDRIAALPPSTPFYTFEVNARPPSRLPPS